MNQRLRARAYKDVTLQQLRSFCETARLGSLKGAADSLGLAHPTVWQQVHALERELGVTLVEPHGRGCRLTVDGQLLLDLAGPQVAALDALKQRFSDCRTKMRQRLTVVTSQRFLVEDLPPVIVEFEKRFPEILLCLREVQGDLIMSSVQHGPADLGPIGLCVPMGPLGDVNCEPIYELDPILVMPRNHPLARRRSVPLKELANYAFVNLPGAFPGAEVRTKLDNVGIFRTEPRRVEATYTASIRRYVEMGLGLGMVVGLPGRTVSNRLHERSLARQLGRVKVMLVWRKHQPLSPPVQAFVEQIKRQIR